MDTLCSENCKNLTCVMFLQFFSVILGDEGEAIM